MRELLAANPRLEALSFPVAAPELNPQERVWKAARQGVSHNHAILRLPGLAERFQGYLGRSTLPSAFLDKDGFNALYPMFN